MAHVISSFQVMDDLCKAFNIPDTHLTKIVITAQVNDVTTVEVTRLVTDDYKKGVLTNKYILSEMPKEVEYSDIDYTKCTFRKENNGACSLVESAIYGKTCQMACSWMVEKEKE